MNTMNPFRCFAMTFAALALFLSPFGCGSNTPETPVAETPAIPATVDGAVATQPMPVPAPAPVMTPAPASVSIEHDAAKVDQEIYRTTGDIKQVVGDAKTDAEKAVHNAKGHVKKAVANAESEAEKEANAIKADARKAAESALDNLLGNPK